MAQVVRHAGDLPRGGYVAWFGYALGGMGGITPGVVYCSSSTCLCCEASCCCTLGGAGS